MAKIYGVGGLNKLYKGYPTQTNQLDVQGGLLGGSAEVKFGELVCFDSTPGVVKAFVASSALAAVAGILVASNAKLATSYPADGAEVGYKVGEGVNLLPFHGANVGGYIAVELDNGCTLSDIAPGKAVAYLNATGKFTTTGTASSTDITGAYFTGVYEDHGTSAAHVYIAEIAVGC